MVGTRQPRFYVQGSANYADRDYWSLSGDYEPPAQSLQPTAAVSARTRSDSRYNVKAGWTPNDTDEYTVNYIKQLGEKGAPLNVYNNPPVPPNSYWRWPYWDVQNTSFLSRTQLGPDVVPEDEGRTTTPSPTASTPSTMPPTRRSRRTAGSAARTTTMRTARRSSSARRRSRPTP